MRYLIALCLICSASAQTRDELRTALVKREGYRQTPYRDSRGTLHVGIGHKLLMGEPNRRWTKAEIERAFTRDLAEATRAAQALFPTFNRHPKAVRIVLIELAFQLGRTGLSNFSHFRAATNRFDYPAASQALERSRLNGQTPDRVKSHRFVLTSARKP